MRQSRMGYWPVTLEGEGSNIIVLVSPNKSDRKGNNKVSKYKLKKYLFGEKWKKNRRISLIDDYYYYSLVA